MIWRKTWLESRGRFLLTAMVLVLTLVWWVFDAERQIGTLRRQTGNDVHALRLHYLRRSHPTVLGGMLPSFSRAGRVACRGPRDRSVHSRSSDQSSAVDGHESRRRRCGSGGTRFGAGNRDSDCGRLDWALLSSMGSVEILGFALLLRNRFLVAEPLVFIRASRDVAAVGAGAVSVYLAFNSQNYFYYWFPRALTSAGS